MKRNSFKKDDKVRVVGRDNLSYSVEQYARIGDIGILGNVINDVATVGFNDGGVMYFSTEKLELVEPKTEYKDEILESIEQLKGVLNKPEEEDDEDVVIPIENFMITNDVGTKLRIGEYYRFDDDSGENSGKVCKLIQIDVEIVKKGIFLGEVAVQLTNEELVLSYGDKLLPVDSLKDGDWVVTNYSTHDATKQLNGFVKNGKLCYYSSVRDQLYESIFDNPERLNKRYE